MLPSVTFADQFPGEPAPRRAPTGDRLDPRRGLPRLPIYYTLDQVASLLSISVSNLTESYLWFMGRDVGVYRSRFLRAVNFGSARRSTSEGGRPPDDWRVPEGELVRWLTVNDLWIYDPAALIDNYEQPTTMRQVRAQQDDDRLQNRFMVGEEMAARIRGNQPQEDPHGGK